MYLLHTHAHAWDPSLFDKLLRTYGFGCRCLLRACSGDSCTEHLLEHGVSKRRPALLVKAPRQGQTARCDRIHLLH